MCNFHYLPPIIHKVVSVLLVFQTTSLSSSFSQEKARESSTMLEGNAIVGETDMLQTMQEDALRLAAKALDFFDVTESTNIARFIKKEFDRTYGTGWQCIVGTDFGSFVTHCYGNFIYFCVGSLAILLFRVSVDPTLETNNQLPVFDAVKA